MAQDFSKKFLKLEDSQSPPIRLSTRRAPTSRKLQETVPTDESEPKKIVAVNARGSPALLFQLKVDRKQDAAPKHPVEIDENSVSQLLLDIMDDDDEYQTVTSSITANSGISPIELASETEFEPPSPSVSPVKSVDQLPARLDSIEEELLHPGKEMDVDKLATSRKRRFPSPVPNCDEEEETKASEVLETPGDADVTPEAPATAPGKRTPQNECRPITPSLRFESHRAFALA